MRYREASSSDKKRMSFVRFALLSTFGILAIHFLLQNPWVFREIADYLDPSHVEMASNELSGIVFKRLSVEFGDRVTRKEEILKQHMKDRSDSDNGSPDMVVFPKSNEEVSTILKICDEYNMIVIPQGYNTGVEGGSVPIYGGVVISSKYLTKIIKLHLDDMHLIVESGLGIREINEYLEKHGLVFNCLPNSYPSIGGAVSTSASGLESLVYGTMKDNVVNLEVVLSTGKIIKTRSRAYKSSAGYDLTSLFIGSEGTLGFITKVTLKVHKIQPVIYAGISLFDNLIDIANSAIEVKQMDLKVNRMEILNGDAMKAVNKYFNATYPLVAHMFLEIRGNDEKEVLNVISKIQNVLEKNNGKSITFTSEKEQRDKLWHSRNKFFYALVKNRDNCPGCRFFHTDLCVPVSSFVEIISQTEKDFSEYFGHSPIVSHAGDSNFHVGLPVDYDNPKEVKDAKDCANRAAKRAVMGGGTVSGEHGIGFSKKDVLILEFGEDAIEVMKSLKRALDPKNMMNPGKIIDI